MKIRHSLFLLMCYTVVSGSCTKILTTPEKEEPKDSIATIITNSTDTIQEVVDPNIKEPDVYVSGNLPKSKFGEQAVYWKNGQLNRLPTIGSVSNVSYASSVCTWNGHFYIGGNETFNGASNALYWLDGKAVTMGLGSIADIKVTDAGIFAAGTFMEKTKDGFDITLPAVWKNGLRTKLPSLDLNAFVTSIAIDNQDIYVSGWLKSYTANSTNAVYWKNDVLVQVEPQKDNFGSQIRSIAISGKNVYAAGSYDASAAYWVNGKRHDLLPDVRSDINSIYVKGTEILMTGSILKSLTESQVVYWKINKNLVELTVPNASASIPRLGLDFYNASTYIPGAMKETAKGSHSIPIYWKNKTLIKLPVDSSGWASDIAVMPVP